MPETEETIEPMALPPQPWGLWVTLGLSVGVLCAYVGVQTVVLFGFIAFHAVADLQLGPLETIDHNGLFICLSVFFSAPIGLALTVLCAWLRKGMPLHAYLGLAATRPGAQVWLLLLILLIVCMDLFSYHFRGYVVPPIILEQYRTAGYVPLFWCVLVVLAPLFEEIFFRGFMFAGFRCSRLGRWGAIVGTSLIWAAIHLQYDLFGMSQIFLCGLFLGYAREKAGSVVITIAMHALMNFIAATEAVVILNWGG